MSKRILMLSTAMVAVLTGAAFADTTIDSSKTTSYTTGALLSSNTGEANAGAITIKSGGSVSVSVASQGALTVDTSDYVLMSGSLVNKDKASVYGVHVDVSANPDLSGASFINNASTTINGTGIYFDNGSATSLSGSGTGKVGLYLDSASCTSTCTYTGNITFATGSTFTVDGDTSYAMEIGSSAVLKGDLTFAGATSVTSGTSTQTATGIYGLYSLGKIEGNVIVSSGGTLATYGQGGQVMSIEGSGVDGYIQIGGSLTSGIPTKIVTSYTQKQNTTTNPEGGAALEIGANVTGGIAIVGATTSGTSVTSGNISVTGGYGSAASTSPVAAIEISPYLNAATSSIAPTSPLTIGVYTGETVDPGFSFYNRGTVTITPSNFNDSAIGMDIVGYSTTVKTVLTGGWFNSGGLQASTVTSGSDQTTTYVSAMALVVGNGVDFGVGSGKNLPTSADFGDQAALVNSGAAGSGTIVASVTGSRGGVAHAIIIAQASSVPSLVNTGTISAVVTTSDASLAGGTSSNNPVAAFAIVDSSGTLTKIQNSGTIQALAGYAASSGATPTQLDNDTQIAVAIDLTGNATTSAASSGVSILNHSSATRAAIIKGDIQFGTGDNQIIDLLGSSSSLLATVTGNVIYGTSKSITSSGDELHVGSYSSLVGSVTTLEDTVGAGVQVDVDAHGSLTLLNNVASLNATNFTVNNGGTFNVGVNQSLTATGGVVSAQNVTFASGSTLSISYASFVPPVEHQFLLMTADPGHLNVDQGTLDAYNHPTTNTVPYLLKSSQLSVVSGTNVDKLVLDVVPKEAVDPVNPLHPDTTNFVGLDPASIAMKPLTMVDGTKTTLFDAVNAALVVDNDLGAAMINGIKSVKQAQNAYDSYAPNVSGGTRAIAISLTDQATGMVGARQRALRMYGKQDGEMTLWGQEFVQMIKDPGQGRLSSNTGYKVTGGFRDHGFGFSLGLDGGSPKYGWYGGALTFYAGDVNELYDAQTRTGRLSHTNQQWYMASLYSVWRGKGLFFDSKFDAGYGTIDSKRFISFTTSNGTYIREAEGKHAAELLSGGFSTGVLLSYGAMTFTPQLSVDGLFLREEGFTETNPGTATTGDAFDLKVNPYYAKSLRAFLGLDLRYDLELWDFYLQPEGRAGYRYDFINDPVKLKAAFAHVDTQSTPAGPGDLLEFVGPDPAHGNFVLGGTISATTDTWTLGLNFDLVRGSNGSFQQVGTLTIVGRI